MSRQTIQLHTIQDWFQLDATIRPVVLQHIKLKDRLYRFIEARRKKPVTEPIKVKCRKCEGSGEIELEPRYAGIHPSQIGRPCLLQTFFDMNGEEKREKPDNRRQLIFDLGHAIHAMFQGYGLAGAWGKSYIHEAPINGNEQPLAEELMVEGHADADNLLVIDDIPNAPIFEVGLIHEYKSINDNGYKGLRSPKPEHKQQAMVYSALRNRPVVVYMYLNKNDQSLSDFPVAFDPALWNSIEGKLRFLKKAYDTGVPPPGEFGYHCDDCPFNYMCPLYKEKKTKKGAA